MHDKNSTKSGKKNTSAGKSCSCFFFFSSGFRYLFTLFPILTLFVTWKQNIACNWTCVPLYSYNNKFTLHAFTSFSSTFTLMRKLWNNNSEILMCKEQCFLSKNFFFIKLLNSEKWQVCVKKCVRTIIGSSSTFSFCCYSVRFSFLCLKRRH